MLLFFDWSAYGYVTFYLFSLQRLVVVEDHYAEGGIGDAVAAALADQEGVRMQHLAVRAIPRSGKPEELLAAFMIDAEHIAGTVRRMIN